MNKINISVFITLLTLSGCFSFSDLDGLKPSDAATSDINSDTDTDTDSDTDSDTDTDTDSDTDSDIDTDIDIDTDTDTDTDSDIKGETGDACDASPACESGNCKNKICCRAGAICCANNTHCDAGLTCNTGSIECHTDCNGNQSLCKTTHYCVQDGDCETKKENGITCTNQVECTSGNCGTHSICCPDSGTCCRDENDCSLPKQICAPNHACTSCKGLIPDLCKAQYPRTPNCDQEVDTCVECTKNDHCRDGGTEPFNSPLGICTPEKTCTCWVESKKGNCSNTSQCPTNSYCALDFDGPGNLDEHAICLRSCDADAGPDSGLACEHRPTAEDAETDKLVWAPMTTCYAFDMFGEDCSSDPFMCTVDSEGSFVDGVCKNYVAPGPGKRCTYSCYDESQHNDWCPYNTCANSDNKCELD